LRKKNKKNYKKIKKIIMEKILEQKAKKDTGIQEDIKKATKGISAEKKIKIYMNKKHNNIVYFKQPSHTNKKIKIYMNKKHNNIVYSKPSYTNKKIKI
jgi:hypothetical protein